MEERGLRHRTAVKHGKASVPSHTPFQLGKDTKGAAGSTAKRCRGHAWQNVSILSSQLLREKAGGDRWRKRCCGHALQIHQYPLASLSPISQGAPRAPKQATLHARAQTQLIVVRYLPRTAKVVQPPAEHELGARAPDAGRLRVAELEFKVLHVFWLAPTWCRGQGSGVGVLMGCMPWL